MTLLYVFRWTDGDSRPGFLQAPISHDLAMVRKVCTRIGVMYFGKMVEVGENRQIFFEPRHAYTKALLSAAPTLDEKPFSASEFGFDPIQ